MQLWSRQYQTPSCKGAIIHTTLSERIWRRVLIPDTELSNMRRGLTLKQFTLRCSTDKTGSAVYKQLPAMH
jgi:hypothetical protein